MRGACEALLARAARDVDAATRARLRVQLYSHPELAGRVLPREASDRRSDSTRRARAATVTGRWPRVLGVESKMAAQILDDEIGAALAVACKGCEPGSRQLFRACAVWRGLAATASMPTRCWMPSTTCPRAKPRVCYALAASRRSRCLAAQARASNQHRVGVSRRSRGDQNHSAWTSCRSRVLSSFTLRKSFRDIAEFPGALGQEHRRAVAVRGHAAAIGG